MLSGILQTGLHKARALSYFVWERLYSQKIQPATGIEIDIVIPAIETDLVLLPLCLEGLRKNLVHQVKDIYLVSPNSEAIRDFAAAHNIRLLHEADFFDYTPADINYIITAGRRKGLNRSGWIYQQLIKLSGKAGTCRYYLVIDADHILLQPHTFITADGKFVFYQSTECHLPYYRAIKRLLGYFPVSFFSYVSHKMLFDKEALKQLQQQIEKNSESRMSWDKIILSNLNSRESSDFSEFELYGNFIAPAKKIMAPWKEKMIAHSGNITYTELKRDYPGKLSITIPHYLRDKHDKA